MSIYVFILYCEIEYRVGKNIIISWNNYLISKSILNRVIIFSLRMSFFVLIYI